MKKLNTKNLTDAICRNLPRLDKRYYKKGDYPGLEFWVHPSGKKSWYFQYRSKNYKYPQRKSLGTYPVVGVVEALKKAKQLSQQIFDGIDPREQIKSDIMSMQLGEALKIYYQNDLTETNQHETNTIKSVKATFGPWVFRDTYDKKILELVSRVEDLQYKKLSSITPKMFKDLFQVCGSKSPITANRLQEYLRKFWNDFVKEEDNPFILKKKFKHDEKIYLDFLDPTELKRVMKNAIVLDDRTGRFNMSHYFGHDRLNVVSCAMIAFLLTTGRRPDEVNKLRWDQYIPGEQPRISLDKTKSSKKNKKLTFRLGKEAVRILQIIQKDRLNNPNSKFYYSIDDDRNKYIFPSANSNFKKNKIAHVIGPRSTWQKLLKISGITRSMKVYATRHTFATNFWIKTKDLKALAEALGNTEAMAAKYAKIVSETSVKGIDQIEFFETQTPKLIQVK